MTAEAGTIAPAAAKPSTGERLLAAEAARIRRRRTLVHSLQVLTLVVVLGAWEICSRTVMDPFMVSSPSKIGQQIWEWLGSGYLLEHVSITLEETAVGFVSGAVVGIVLGILLANSQLASKVLNPYINALYSLPKVALGPLFVVWFGLGVEMKYVMSAAFVVFLVFYSTWNGIAQVSEDLVESLRVMGASRMQIVRRVMLPSALTWMFSGLRISFPQALIGAVVGEIIAANRGVGYVIENSSAQFNTTGVFAGILVLTIAAVIFDRLLTMVQNRVFRWNPDSLRA
ncbi:ABC transporter permease [Dactylosporangium sp. CA-092794]|uniref:ABC transporter permease n=1 Tax=Dactylosporangium sp. CA-092794 TaxID=3239929 RepID=UPI003D8E192D